MYVLNIIPGERTRFSVKTMADAKTIPRLLFDYSVSLEYDNPNQFASRNDGSVE
jgi:hypothetical protein